mmetsp:Transcript_68440/g.113768  ORF Transcript_68440/g.113768 Transcript_68440/m.113768 type:complete len:457 (+) Transcript_68440:78-1448(+)
MWPFRSRSRTDCFVNVQPKDIAARSRNISSNAAVPASSLSDGKEVSENMIYLSIVDEDAAQPIADTSTAQPIENIFTAQPIENTSTAQLIMDTTAAEPRPAAAEPIVDTTATERVLSSDDELYLLLERLDVMDWAWAEGVCQAWRRAILAQKRLVQECTLYPVEPYPMPRNKCIHSHGFPKSPSAVLALPNGEVCIADTGNDMLAFGSPDTGALRLVVGQQDSLERVADGVMRATFELTCPMGVTCDRLGEHVFVSDTLNHQIVKLCVSDGSCAGVAGTHGIDEGELIQPKGIAVAGDNLYVCDVDNNRVQVFSASQLCFRFIIGEKGDQAGQFHKPHGLCAHQERLYVTEFRNQRLQVFTLEGEVLHVFGGVCEPDRLMSPFGVAIFLGYIVVAESDTSQQRLRVFTMEGKQVQVLRPLHKGTCMPRGLSSHGQRLYLADSKGHTVHVFSVYGAR